MGTRRRVRLSSIIVSGGQRYKLSAPFASRRDYMRRRQFNRKWRSSKHVDGTWLFLFLEIYPIKTKLVISLVSVWQQTSLLPPHTATSIGQDASNVQVIGGHYWKYRRLTLATRFISSCFMDVMLLFLTWSLLQFLEGKSKYICSNFIWK